MKLQELAACVEELHPDNAAAETARVCLLLSNWVEDLEELRDRGRLRSACQAAEMRLQVATDQHAAMTQELEELAASDPEKFSSQQIWILVRAIKVQSQVLQLYLGEAALDI